MRTLVLRAGDIAACPKFSMLPEHYRDDRTCKCGDRKAVLEQIVVLEAEIRDRQKQLHKLYEKLRVS